MALEGVRARLAQLAAVQHVLIVIALCSSGLLLVGVLGWIAGLPVLGYLMVPVGVTGLAVVVLAKRSYTSHAADLAEQALRRSLQRTGLMKFDLDHALAGVELSAGAVRLACTSVYRASVLRAIADLEVTPAERAALDMLRSKLGLSQREGEKVEKAQKREAYARELGKRLGDGQLTAQEASELRALRAALDLTDAEAFDATKGTVVDAYRSLFRRFAEDGRLSPSEVARLQGFASATAMTLEQAAGVQRKDALALYRRTVSMICQDGIVTDQELAELEALERALELSPRDTRGMKVAVERVMEFGRIRAGALPTVSDHGLLLKSTEVCHLRSQCRYQYRTKAGAREFAGELTVTDRRVIFNAPERSFDFPIKRILNVAAGPTGVKLRLSTTKGQGVYHVDDAEKLEAILYALVRRQNFAAAEGSDAARSRHIPDHVKVEVWQRDGAACVRCGASDYLEFDHIIPFSKGGANSARNIQLLCRRCNLAKGAELV